MHDTLHDLMVELLSDFDYDEIKTECQSLIEEDGDIEWDEKKFDKMLEALINHITDAVHQFKG